MSGVLSFQEKLTREFNTFEGNLNGQAQSSIHMLRQQAMKRFVELGFPTIRHEEWRYTNLFPVLQHEYEIMLQSPSQLTQADIEPFLLPHTDANIIVLVNGVYVQALSRLVSSSDALQVMPLAEALKRKPMLIEQHFARYAAWQDDAMVALNTAFSVQGVYIEVAPKAVIEEPIHLISVNDAQRCHTFIPMRHLITIGAGAEVSIVETTSTFCAEQYASLTHSVSEILLAHNASLHLYMLQNDREHAHCVHNTHVYQEAHSTFRSIVITLSGGLVRNTLNTVLAGHGADAHLYGLYLVEDKTLVDNHTCVEHAVAHCTSNELYKGVLDGSATGVFNGKIIVRPHAQKTLAYQSNRNILLSRAASIHTKPQLEIFADDVKCSHGCTSGQLDDEALFYLRARGLGQERAQALLLYAFAGEMTEKIDLEPLREHVESVIAARLHQERD
ncbi:MAG: Fe-S cluster assembly protein SufD [Bacteroidota bacterium]|nr:Fe-S cluster assembly protein SufD [Candidatus Kapabacteria bacterium]MDW8219283.1 Fe-S cluster assembly protein SufD [Bacteroidota bacterium]